MRRRAIFVVAEGQCPHPGASYGRGVGLEDAADHHAIGVHVVIVIASLIWRLRSGRESMFCAPILHSLGIDSLIRAHDAIDGMTLMQLRTGIL
jgi:hypothetical protein